MRVELSGRIPDSKHKHQSGMVVRTYNPNTSGTEKDNSLVRRQSYYVTQATPELTIYT